MSRPDQVQTGSPAVVQVHCGANVECMVAGKTVSQARAELGELLNIPKSDQLCLVNGDQVAQDYVLQPNDRLEFVKGSGRNG